MTALQTRIEFLTLLAFTQIECGRNHDAVGILRAVRLLQPQNMEASRLLALAQLRDGDAHGCLATIDLHQQQFGQQDKSRQMNWLKIRGLHCIGKTDLSRQLLRQLRSDIQNPLVPTC